jgi:hypothetical protein
MGKIYYPKYRVNAYQTRRMLRAGTWILLTSLFIFSIPLILAGEPVKTILQWILHNNPLSYYVLAFATAPIWFRMISLFKSEYVGCAVLMITFYSAYQALSLWLEPYDEIEGPISAWLLIAKFNYFNMSFGVIGGCAAGIYLAKNAGEELSVLSRRFSVLGIACVALGLFILYLRSGSLQSLGADAKDMGLWRWVLYSGWVLVLGGSLAAAVAQLEKWPSGLRRGAEVIATVGQCTFPIFVVHITLFPLKPVLNRLSIPDSVGFSLLLVTFIGFSAWCVSSLYRLHYAKSYREP